MTSVQDRCDSSSDRNPIYYDLEEIRQSVEDLDEADQECCDEEELFDLAAPPEHE